jgi:hypothetical protein
MNYFADFLCITSRMDAMTSNEYPIWINESDAMETRPNHPASRRSMVTGVTPTGSTSSTRPTWVYLSSSHVHFVKCYTNCLVDCTAMSSKSLV